MSTPPPARDRMDINPVHAHEVRRKIPSQGTASPVSKGMPLRVTGTLALVVGLASGFGYATFNKLQAQNPDDPLGQFQATDSETGADKPKEQTVELIEEPQDDTLAGLFQVPAETPPVAAPTPAPAGNPFDMPTEPDVVPVAKPKPSKWAGRNGKTEALVSDRQPVASPSAPPMVASKENVDPAVFDAVAPSQGEPMAAAGPLILPGAALVADGEEETISTTIASQPFQRPLVEAAPRGPVMPVQFEAAPTNAGPTLGGSAAVPPAQDGFGFADEAPAPALAPPPAGRSTVPSFDLGSPPPTQSPQPVPVFSNEAPLSSSESTIPVRRPAPFAGGQEPAASPVPLSAPAQPPQWPAREEPTAVSDPFRPSATPAGNGQYSGEEAVHTVEAGENYWTISRKHYGMGRYFVALAEFNKARIPDPKKLKPGMKIVVPTSATLTDKYAHLISGATPVKTYAQTADAAGGGAGAIQQVGFFVDPTGQPVYRVSEGDTLSDIAQNCLGRSSRWVQIYGLNRDNLKTPNDLKLGMILRLPQDASGVQPAPDASVLR